MDRYPFKQSSNSLSLVIRKVQQQDLRELADILAESFHLQMGWMQWLFPILRMGIYEDLRSRLRSVSPHYICLVALIPTDAGNTLVGTVEVALRSTYPLHFQEQYPYLSNLAVRKEYRRLGVARQLLNTCEQTVIGWGFYDLHLHVLEDNTQARQLYFTSGYRLQEADPIWLCWLLRRPRRLFLHKKLIPNPG